MLYILWLIFFQLYYFLNYIMWHIFVKLILLLRQHLDKTTVDNTNAPVTLVALIVLSVNLISKHASYREK